MATIERILHLFETRGARDYLGEPVTQLEHALQAAHVAASEGASDALVAAALLHDVGHLLGPEEDPAEQGIDAVHEEIGGKWLASRFGPEVTEPVRLHVPAKRYLCAVDAAYHAGLSAASVKSLVLQGGPFDVEETRRFERNPWHRDAVRLRRWDDAAKIPGLAVPGLESYIGVLERAVRQP